MRCSTHSLSVVTSRLPQAEIRSYWNRTEVRCILVGVHVASLFMAYHCLCGLRLLFPCPKCQSGFLTPGAFCSLAAVWVVVPESLPAHWTTHLDSLLSFFSLPSSLVPVCPLIPPCFPSSTISVCPHSGWSASHLRFVGLTMDFCMLHTSPWAWLASDPCLDPFSLASCSLLPFM